MGYFIFQNADEHVFKVLVGNKCDKEDLRVVPTCHGESLAKKFDIPFYETSAKEDINIKNVIDGMTNKILKKVTSNICRFFFISLNV